MADLSARTRVIALSRAAEGGQLEHPPRRGTRFAGGDEAYLLGPYEELLRVLRRDQTAPRTRWMTTGRGEAPDPGEGPGDARRGARGSVRWWEMRRDEQR
jgi:hypothetical protein